MKPQAVAHGPYGALMNQLRKIIFLEKQSFLFPVTSQPDQFSDPVQDAIARLPAERVVQTQRQAAQARMP